MSEVVYDYTVVGLGAMGCAIAYHLSKRGYKVLGLERQEEVGHSYGSSHGDTRITRKAYFENPNYVTLVCRAYDLFLELEETVGQKLLYKTGGIDVGPKGSPMVEGARTACITHNLPYEELNSEEIRARFPGFTVPDGYIGIYQADAGVLRPERVNRAHFAACFKYDFTPKFSQIVKNVTYNESEDVFTITTTNNTCGDTMNNGNGKSNTFTSKKVILCTGAWMQSEALQYDVVRASPVYVQKGLELLEIERQAITWHCTDTPEVYHHSKFPVTLIHHVLDETATYKSPDGNGTHTYNNSLVFEVGKNHFYYTFPVMDGERSVKMARYNHLREIVHPDTVNRKVTTQDIETDEDIIKHFFPNVKLPIYNNVDETTQLPENVAKSAICMFTNTPDGHFIIDAYNMKTHEKKNKNIAIISACSGHGFKFASAIGESIADLMEDKDRPDLTWLDSTRFMKNL